MVIDYSRVSGGLVSVKRMEYPGGFKRAVSTPREKARARCRYTGSKAVNMVSELVPHLVSLPVPMTVIGPRWAFVSAVVARRRLHGANIHLYSEVVMQDCNGILFRVRLQHSVIAS